MTRPSLERFAAARLRALDRRSLRRELVTTERHSSPHVRQDGRDLVSFACNDYLGLSHHIAVITAEADAAARYGTGAAASRLVTGNHPVHARLERRIAEITGTAAAVVFGSGYLANVGAITALAGERDLLLVDELGHSCHRSGAALSGARVLAFRHNDVAHAAALLEQERGRHRHCLVVTEGVFSMDGDLAPLAPLAELAARYDAWLMVDDAHGLGVVGGGRGSAFAAADGPVPVDVQTGALSKAAASYGGYVASSAAVADLIRNRARTFVYSTALPPGAAAAAAKALEIVAADRERVERPVALARLFTASLGLPPAESPIVPLVLGGARRALDARARLLDAGFLVAAIRPPTVPPGTSRLRLTFCATHTEEQVRRLAAAVAPLLER